jgi:hypothetical protein
MKRQLIILCGLIIASGLCAHADEIVLKRSVRMRNADGRVVLRDIARIEGEHAQRWSGLEVGVFRDSTRPLELTVDDVRRALLDAGANRARFDLSGNTVIVRPFGMSGSSRKNTGPAACAPMVFGGNSPATVDNTSPVKIKVEPKLREMIFDPRTVLTEDSPRGLIAERLLAGLGGAEGPYRIRIRMEDPTVLNVREGQPSLEATGDTEEGFRGFRIHLAGKPVGTALATLETKAMVHRARVEMKRGECVDVDDVSVRTEWMPIDQGREMAVITPMIGSKLDMRVQADTILQPRHFVPSVKRNSPIKVRSGGTGWSMMLDCIALEEGRPGDTITVRSNTPGVQPRDARPIQVVVQDSGHATLLN